MFNFRTKTDANKEIRQQAIEKQNEQMKNLQIACKEIFRGQNGLYILRFLKEICLWDSETTNIEKDLLAYRSGRRDIWLIMRSLLPKDILAQVEIYGNENN